MQTESLDLNWKYHAQKITVIHNPYCIVIDNLFGPQKSNEIFDHIISLREHFEPAEIVYEGNLKVDETYRKNMVCPIDYLYRIDKPEWSAKREYRKQSPLLGAVDGLMESKDLSIILKSAPLPICKFEEINVWETQISRYGDDKAHYEWHYDRLSNDDRLITLVYYINMEPKKFQGGDLILSNGLSFGKQIVATNSNENTIKPRNDRLVIFNSRTAHKVSPTLSSSKFEEGRFSVNIWAGIRENQNTVSNY